MTRKLNDIPAELQMSIFASCEDLDDAVCLSQVCQNLRRYVHFGVNLPCLIATLGHIPPFHAHVGGLRALVLYQSLGRWTKYSSKILLPLPNLFD